MYQYNSKLDRMHGHDYPGLHHSGMAQYVLDEIELGARAALVIDEPDQTWSALFDDQYPAHR